MCICVLNTNGMREVWVCFFFRKNRYINLCKLNALDMQHSEMHANKIYRRQNQIKIALLDSIAIFEGTNS